MSTTIGVHLDHDDEWCIQDCTQFDRPFVSMTIHDNVVLYVHPDSIDALVAAIEETKTILDHAGKKEPS